MLSLTVRDGEYITIGPDIVVQVLKTGDVFRVAIDAPRELGIQRSKVRERGADAPGCIQRVRSLKNPPRPYSHQGFKQAAE